MPSLDYLFRIVKHEDLFSHLYFANCLVCTYCLDMNIEVAPFPEWAVALRLHRLSLRKSQADIEADSNFRISQMVVSRLERGIVHPTQSLSSEQLAGYMEAMGLDPKSFEAISGLPFPLSLPDHPDEVPVRSIRIPIVDAGAGLPIWDPGHGEWIDVDLPDLRRYQRGDLFGVRVWGDSMLPTVVAGDIVVCARDERAENGRMVAAWVDDGLLIKRVLRDNGTVWLASDNVAYPPQRAKGDLRVFGVARALVREFK